MNAKPLIDTFFTTFSDLENRCEKAQSEVSKIDKQIADIYHEIEGRKIKHVSESHAIYKRLKAKLEERRLVKYNAILLRSLCDNLSGKIKDAKAKSHAVTKKHNDIMDSLEKNFNK